MHNKFVFIFAFSLFLVFSATFAQEEERCDDFGSCLNNCVKILPQGHSYMDIIDCSDKCVKTNCRDVHLNPIVNPPGKKTTSSSSSTTDRQSNNSPSSRENIDRKSKKGEDVEERRKTATPLPNDENENVESDLSVRFLRPLPGEIFPDGSGIIHFIVDGSDGSEGEETEILVNNLHATKSSERELSFRIEALEEGQHQLRAIVRGENGGESDATVTIRAIPSDSAHFDDQEGLAMLPIKMENGNEERIMIRRDVGANSDQLGLRCSREGSWVDIPLPPAASLESIAAGLGKRFTRLYGVGDSKNVADAVAYALRELNLAK